MKTKSDSLPRSPLRRQRGRNVSSQSAPLLIPLSFLPKPENIEEDSRLLPMSTSSSHLSSSADKFIPPSKPMKSQTKQSIFGTTSPKKNHFQLCRSAPVRTDMKDLKSKHEYFHTSTPNLIKTPIKRYSFDQFTQEHVIGKGSFSIVYKVTHHTDPSKPQYALKKIDRKYNNSSSDRKKVKTEIELGLWDHPTIVRYIGGWTEKDDTFILSELCDYNLPDFICHQRFSLSESQIWSLIHDMSSALYFIHNSGIVHRDIKPENILVNMTASGPIFKLADFGCAHKVHQLSSTFPRDGDARYLAPECILNIDEDENNINFESCDIFSLGLTTFQLVCDWPKLPGGGELYWDLRKGRISWRLAVEHKVTIKIEEQILQYSNILEKSIQDMCDPNPEKRPTAAILLEEPPIKKSPRPFDSPIMSSESTHHSSSICEDFMEVEEQLLPQLKKGKKESSVGFSPTLNRHITPMALFHNNNNDEMINDHQILFQDD